MPAPNIQHQHEYGGNKTKLTHLLRGIKHDPGDEAPSTSNLDILPCILRDSKRDGRKQGKEYFHPSVRWIDILPHSLALKNARVPNIMRRDLAGGPKI